MAVRGGGFSGGTLERPEARALRGRFCIAA